jgi:hypothetical protein
MTKYEYFGADSFDLFWPILYEGNENDIIYVYRIGPDAHLVKPYLLKSETYPDFIEWLRDTYGHGNYHLLVRRGRVMIFSGNICI